MNETVAIFVGLFILFGWPAIWFQVGRYTERYGWPVLIRWRGWHRRDDEE